MSGRSSLEFAVRWVKEHVREELEVTRRRVAGVRRGLRLPAWSHRGEPVYGIVCLFMIPCALLTLFWWANPLFFAGCVALAQGRSFRAMALGIVATALATLFFPLWNRGYGSGIGSAFWVAAMACLAIAGFLAGRSEAGARTRSGSKSGEVRASGPHDAPSTSDAGSSSPSKVFDLPFTRRS